MMNIYTPSLSKLILAVENPVINKLVRKGKRKMLDVVVNKDFKLKSDGMQIIIQRSHVVDPTLSPNFKEGDDTKKRQEWKSWKYCGKIEHALNTILKQRIFESDAKTLKELRNEIVSFKQEVKALLVGEDD